MWLLVFNNISVFSKQELSSNWFFTRLGWKIIMEGNFPVFDKSNVRYFETPCIFVTKVSYDGIIWGKIQDLQVKMLKIKFRVAYICLLSKQRAKTKKNTSGGHLQDRGGSQSATAHDNRPAEEEMSVRKFSN